MVKLLDIQPGTLADLGRDTFPACIAGWRGGRLALDAAGTHFLFALDGPATLACGSGTFAVAAGMYAAVPGSLTVEHGRGIAITRFGYHGFFHLGGPVEATGRLRYIDGCTDSLLVPPVIRGDPCLNLLCLPPGTRQTPHVHPSFRTGVIIRGRGWCLAEGRRLGLAPGQAFVIDAGEEHCFHTDCETMLVLAFHPDSDVGPVHEDHPMINRTFTVGNREQWFFGEFRGTVWRIPDRRWLRLGGWKH
jgi:quercetin dioxygenase-like cupin family protein